MRVVLLGPPGSGKGTQGRPLASHLGVPYLSTGEVLRAEVEAGSALGRRVEGVLESGGLVPDELMLEVVAAALDRGGDGYVLDGFPRTVTQAEMIERRLADLAARVTPTDQELKLGVFTALVGAPLFALIAWRAARSWRT